MLSTQETIDTQELNSINNFFNQFEKTVEPVFTEEETQKETPVTKYISSLVCGQYAKAVDAIENTVVGNKLKRKRNLQQVMRESFFYGANRFGNNFIA